MGLVRGRLRVPRRVLIILTGAALVQGSSCAAHTASPPAVTVSSRPDIVLIITDDQRYDTLHVMPQVQRLLIDGGMQFKRAIITNPLCCPSRATMLTGRYSHTTGVYFNGGPHGGWHAFRGSESSTIATALDRVGYRTALFGKYMNGYGGNGPLCPARLGPVVGIHRCQRRLLRLHHVRRPQAASVRFSTRGPFDRRDRRPRRLVHPWHFSPVASVHGGRTVRTPQPGDSGAASRRSLLRGSRPLRPLGERTQRV